MIKDNRLLFGYGDISICPHFVPMITFEYFEPTSYPGGPLPENYKGIESRDLWLDSLHEANELLKALNSVSKDNPIFTFKNLIFDFSNYNEKSVEIVKIGVNKSISAFLASYAA